MSASSGLAARKQTELCCFGGCAQKFQGKGLPAVASVHAEYGCSRVMADCIAAERQQSILVLLSKEHGNKQVVLLRVPHW